MKPKTVNLTKEIKVKDSSHILYFFASETEYIKNLVSFILTAKQLNQHVVIIDNQENYQLMMEQLQKHFSTEELNQFFQYINNYDFYEMYGDFHFARVLNNFKTAVQPFVNNGISLRVWGYVDWREQENVEKNLHAYESEADLCISELGFITVCCYNGRKVPAYIQTELMKSHEYFMTDKDLFSSSLYNKSEETIFPSLSAQKNIENEVDLYKQKLDFIHVVAHEVRNPLTVIKSFATIIKSEVDNEDIKTKLSLIEDYSVAIDHEIHHIIQTEQMMTLDTFWKKKLITVYSPIKEVLEVMTIKARTQNIHIHADINICQSIIINGNLMGFRLIISNILSNAVKYSYEGGTVYFSVHADDHSLIITVTDEGIGISEEEVEKLFQKYQKLNEDVPGQGIGLYMVYKLVNHFGGTISVNSTLGKGTSFQLSFPL